MTENEVRTVPENIEVRKATNSDYIGQLVGVAISFNQKSQMLDNFIEIIDSHSLDSIDLSDSDIVMLNGHNYENPVGRNTKNLHLQLKSDGLHFILDLIDSQESRDLLENVKNGIVSGCSFGFTVEADEWNGNIRTVTKINKLYELSAVVAPAYKTTTLLQTRSLEMSEKTEETQEETPDLQAELDALKAEIEALKAGDSQEDSEEQTDSADDKADDSEEENTPKGEKKNMQTFNKAQDTESTEVRNFNAYLKGEIEKRDLNTTNGAPIIPHELLAEQYQPQASTGVLSLVNTVSVDSNNVTLPVVKHATKGFTAVSVENSDTVSVEAPAIQEVHFDLKLYSGALPMSYQLAHSSKSAQRVILQHITAMRDLTRLQKVGALLKTASPKTVKDIDGIKDLYNADSFVNYPDANKSFIMTAEMFAELDKAKDTTGAYILQPLATDATKKSIGGYPVEVVSSDVLGAGKVAFFGDVKAFIVEAINENMIFTYQENRNLSTVAVGGVFFDSKVADSDAGVFITYTPAGK